jgi:hypothetical protein
MAKQRKINGKKEVNVGIVLRRRLWLLVLLAFIPAVAVYILTFAFLGQWLGTRILGFFGVVLLVGPGFAAQQFLQLTWRDITTGWFNFLVVTVLGAAAAFKRMDISFFYTAVMLLSALYLLVAAGIGLGKLLSWLGGSQREANKPKK